MIGTVHIRVALVLVSAAIGLSAQAPAAARDAVERAAARQRAAAASQVKALAHQRSSVERQAAPAGKGAFFLLPPPPGSGVTVAAPAPLVAACEALPPPEIDSLVEQAAKRQDLDEDVLRSVIRQESAFRPCAVSPKGAMGLMQLMPATASQFGVSNPFDPVDNVEGGAAFLKQLLGRYGGDLPMALGAYNAGPSRVDASWGIPNIPETQDYVKRILSMLPVMP